MWPQYPVHMTFTTETLKCLKEAGGEVISCLMWAGVGGWHRHHRYVDGQTDRTVQISSSPNQRWHSNVNTCYPWKNETVTHPPLQVTKLLRSFLSPAGQNHHWGENYKAPVRAGVIPPPMEITVGEPCLGGKMAAAQSKVSHFNEGQAPCPVLDSQPLV